MSNFQSQFPYVEVKVFRGQPRIFIRPQSNDSNKKPTVKSLSYKEWQALTNCSPTIDEQVWNLSKTNDSVAAQSKYQSGHKLDDKVNTVNTACNDFPSAITTVAEAIPNYTVDEQVVADLLSILQQTGQYQGPNLTKVF